MTIGVMFGNSGLLFSAETAGGMVSEMDAMQT